LLTSVKIGPSPAKVLFDIPLACMAHRMARINGYDVIHGVEEAGFIACWLGRKFETPYVYDMHSWMSQQIEDGKFFRSDLFLNLFKKIESFAMNGAKAIVTVGPEMTGIVKTRLAPGVFAATLPDCPIMIEGTASPELRSSIESRFNGLKKKVILYTGNFHPYQGIDLLLKSIKELKATDLNGGFRLFLVGGGAGETEAISKFKEMAKNVGISEEVVFCGEHPPEAMPVFIEKSDILVSSRVSGNNVPLKIYTYLASGKLLVATKIPSHTQVLSESNSLLADPDPQALAQTLYRGLVAISEEQRQRLSITARTIGCVDQFRKFKSVLADCYDHCAC